MQILVHLHHKKQLYPCFLQLNIAAILNISLFQKNNLAADIRSIIGMFENRKPYYNQ